MSKLSAYCKAYPAALVATYPGWPGIAEPDAEYLFVHDNYFLTRGIYVDEDIILSDSTPEWVAFCGRDLQFAVPDDVRNMNAPAPPESSQTTTANQ